MRTKRSKQRGFSLLELLIVVAIMLVIAAIAIPAFNKAKRASNEAAAVQALKSFASAEATYNTQYEDGFGTPAVLALTGDGCNDAGLLPPQFGTNGGFSQGGYTFAITMVNTLPTATAGCAAAGSAGYVMTAVPQVINQTGVRGFRIDETGTIRYDPNGAAPTLGSSVLGQ